MLNSYTLQLHLHPHVNLYLFVCKFSTEHLDLQKHHAQQTQTKFTHYMHRIQHKNNNTFHNNIRSRSA